MNNPVNANETTPKRRRRTAESAKREILDAAKARLTAEGPDGIRLKGIAQDLGISHSSILHHFGSRDGLMKDLREDAFASLANDLKRRLAEPSQGDPSIEFFEKIAMTFQDEGNGRILAWQLMAGQGPRPASIGVKVLGEHGASGLLDGLAKMLHEQTAERGRKRDLPAPPLEEIRALVAMFACTILGEAIAGDLMVRSSGIGRTPEARKSFRAFVAKHAERMVFPPAPKARTEARSEPPMQQSDSSAAASSGDSTNDAG